MSGKRPAVLSLTSAKRRKSVDQNTYFQRTLQDCGLVLNNPPDKCEATKVITYIVKDIKKSLKEHNDYPLNIEKFIKEFETACEDNKTFEHYLFLNVVRRPKETSYNVDFSVIKILLNVTFLQTKLIPYIFDKAFEVITQTEFGPWVKMILKSLSNLDTIECPELISTKLIDLLDVSSDKFVRLEIISAIPDIIGDREHDNVASEMSRIMCNEREARELIPSILDCLTYLSLSDEQFQRLQKETLTIMQPSNSAYFSIFVKFLLTPGRLSDSGYEETIKDLRRQLGWCSMIGSENDIATSQILTAKEIRNSMLSSKALLKSWIKVISSCSTHAEHKPIDIVFFLIIASLSDEKEKQIENEMRKEVKLQILREDLVNKAFNMFKPILKENIKILIRLANSLLKPGADPSVEAFGAHMHMVMFSELPECRPKIISELLQLLCNFKSSALNTLNILNNIASENLSLMKPESKKIMKLLDRLEDRSLTEVRAIMNLVCGLAYSFEDSDIRDDLYIIIRKELASCIPLTKNQGIIAGVHAVKYLMKRKQEVEIDVEDGITLSNTDALPEGDLREAGQIIELIHCSTAQFPKMLVFFYDELCKIILSTKAEKTFLNWLYKALSNYWQENFLVQNIDKGTFGEIKLSMKYCLNSDSEVDEQWAVNIGGLVMEDNKDINIIVLSPLFQLVRALLQEKEDGDLSEIDALVGCSVVMPIIDVDCLQDMSDSSVKKVLDCYILYASWIRELLRAFISRADAQLKPKILNRVAHLRELEKDIDKIRSRVNKPERDDSVLAGSSTKAQQTQGTQTAKSKVNANNEYLRPLDLTLIDIVKYDLTPLNANENELTFEILTYVLGHINRNLEKILVPRIKKKTFLSKESTVIYSYSEAQSQAKVVSDVLPKLMDHINLILSYLDCHVIEDGRMDLETLNTLNIMESLWCLEHIYNLLTIYFGWIEFKNRNVPLLKSSLQIVAKETNDTLLVKDLVQAVAESFQNHERYIITISSAAALIQFMKTLQELSTGPSVAAILENMARKFLSKQWKTLNDELEKGLSYNQYLDSLTKVYLENNELKDLKDIITALIEDVDNLRDKTTVLPTLKSINKSNFSLLFKNIGAVLCEKIKCYLNGGHTNGEHVEMWTVVATILKLMAGIVTSVGNKPTASHFFRISIPILHLFLSKGFPILSIEFKANHQKILDVFKDLQTSTECLLKICSQTTDSALMQKIPSMQELLTSLIYKTKDLLKANECSEALKMINIPDVPAEPKRKSRKSAQKVVQVDETVEDLDEDMPAEDSDGSHDEMRNLDFVGVSDML